jgi:hypothetical protein
MLFHKMVCLTVALATHFSSAWHWSPLKSDMAGAEEAPAGVELKGWQLKFNSYTKTGRANVAMATFGGIFACWLLHKGYKHLKMKVSEATDKCGCDSEEK